MIPTGQESRQGTDVDGDSTLSPVRGLLAAIRQLAATAESDLPPSAKLELLIVQIGTARFWADELSDTFSSAPRVPAPHFDAATHEAAHVAGRGDV